MPEPARTNEIDVIIGRKASGKSTLARGIVAKRERRIILDPMREHTDGAVFSSYTAAAEYLERVRHGRYSVILRTLDPDDELRALALSVYGDPDSPMLPGVTILIDECDRLCSPAFIPPALHRAVNYGRHFGVSIVAVARRPRRMHRDITANADRIHIGITQEPADLDYLAEFVGTPLADRARDLREPGQFVTWPDDLEPRADPDPPAPRIHGDPPNA